MRDPGLLEGWKAGIWKALGIEKMGFWVSFLSWRRLWRQGKMVGEFGGCSGVRGYVALDLGAFFFLPWPSDMLLRKGRVL